MAFAASEGCSQTQSGLALTARPLASLVARKELSWAQTLSIDLLPAHLGDLHHPPVEVVAHGPFLELVDLDQVISISTRWLHSHGPMLALWLHLPLDWSSSSTNSKLFSSLSHVLGSGGAHPIAEAPRWAMLPFPAPFSTTGSCAPPPPYPLLAAEDAVGIGVEVVPRSTTSFRLKTENPHHVVSSDHASSHQLPKARLSSSRSSLLC